MQLEALVLRLRPMRPAEAADLGTRLVGRAARSLYPCCALALLPVLALALATAPLAGWLPPLVLWWGKPWLDRTLLFVLSRAAFGVTTRPGEVWAARREVWLRQLPSSWTLRRLSASRAFTQPVHQLEQLRGAERRARLRQLRAGQSTASRLLTGSYSMAETALMIACASLALWFAPQGRDSGVLLERLLGGNGFAGMLGTTLLYALVILFLEPFYVASGFAMYLNRRVELEAWDVEQELRRAFAT